MFLIFAIDEWIGLDFIYLLKNTDVTFFVKKNMH